MADPVVCSSCGARFPVSSLANEDYRILYDQHQSLEFMEKLRTLQKVQDFYRRFPEAEGYIKPDCSRALLSKAAEVLDQLFSGNPFDKLELPPLNIPEAWVETAYDREVVEYVKHHDFDLRAKMRDVSDEIEELEARRKFLPCPHCHSGKLHVPQECWNQFLAADGITWYRPGYHGFDDDGTLYIKASGYEGRGAYFSHWTGEFEISPTQPDYDFWCWFVDQKQYRRLVKETELPDIKDRWARSMKPGACKRILARLLTRIRFRDW